MKAQKRAPPKPQGGSNMPGPTRPARRAPLGATRVLRNTHVAPRNHGIAFHWPIAALLQCAAPTLLQCARAHVARGAFLFVRIHALPKHAHRLQSIQGRAVEERCRSAGARSQRRYKQQVGCAKQFDCAHAHMRTPSRASSAPVRPRTTFCRLSQRPAQGPGQRARTQSPRTCTGTACPQT